MFENLSLPHLLMVVAVAMVATVHAGGGEPKRLLKE